MSLPEVMLILIEHDRQAAARRLETGASTYLASAAKWSASAGQSFRVFQRSLEKRAGGSTLQTRRISTRAFLSVLGIPTPKPSSL